MKKLINWIWSNKKQETETYVIERHQMVDEKARIYNEAHGLPLDQLVG
ncbi:MAG: hypothetical protein U0M29_11500 [Streptococcus salivarius]|nr:MAG: hypothetical protein [Bacteriophage sp.]